MNPKMNDHQNVICLVESSKSRGLSVRCWNKDSETFFGFYNEIPPEDCWLDAIFIAHGIDEAWSYIAGREHEAHRAKALK